MPVITNLLAIALFILIVVCGLSAIAGIAYWLTRNDIRKQDRLKCLTTLVRAVVAVSAAVISAGTAVIYVGRFLRIGPGG